MLIEIAMYTRETMIIWIENKYIHFKKFFFFFLSFFFFPLLFFSPRRYQQKLLCLVHIDARFRLKIQFACKPSEWILIVLVPADFFCLDCKFIPRPTAEICLSFQWEVKIEMKGLMCKVYMHCFLFCPISHVQQPQ